MRVATTSTTRSIRPDTSDRSPGQSRNGRESLNRWRLQSPRAESRPPSNTSRRPPSTSRWIRRLASVVEVGARWETRLFTATRPDPYDEKVLLTVKEAAWMLSLPEHAIRQAVSVGDLDRVFIGEGGKNYRIVHGSLLAWVNSMPRESARASWWR